MKNQNNHEFWVTNISNKKDISLGDLRITIRRGESKNLLDQRYYKYTLEQLQQSAESGSIKIKSRFIKVRDVPPKKTIVAGKYTSKQNRYFTGLRSNLEIEVPKFEDLDLDTLENDEIFAAESIEFAEEDHMPILPIVEDKDKA